VSGEPRRATGEFAPGLVPHNKRWTPEACVDRAWAWYHATGRAPTASEWQPHQLETRCAGGDEAAAASLILYHELGCPNYSQVHRLFGRWSDLMYAAGLLPYVVQKPDYVRALAAHPPARPDDEVPL
jgi:hypothetical protein